MSSNNTPVSSLLYTFSTRFTDSSGKICGGVFDQRRFYNTQKARDFAITGSASAAETLVSSGKGPVKVEIWFSIGINPISVKAFAKVSATVNEMRKSAPIIIYSYLSGGTITTSYSDPDLNSNASPTSLK